MQVVGRFLALLELIRSHRVRAEQERIFGTIYVFLLEEVPDEAPAAETTAAAPETPPAAALENVEPAPRAAEAPSALPSSEEAPHEHTE